MSGIQEGSGGKLSPMILGKNTADLLGVESLTSIQILTPWYQGGSETYVTDFLLTREGESPKHLIAKACIKMGARYAMAEWFKRRERLAENGITFPIVHAIDEPGATWVEEFIPHTYKEAYEAGDDQRRSELKKRFVNTFLRMEGAGFTPKGMHDLRSHGEDVVAIDVGEDLGGWKENDYCDLGAYIRAERFFRAEIPRG